MNRKMREELLAISVPMDVTPEGGDVDVAWDGITDQKTQQFLQRDMEDQIYVHRVLQNLRMHAVLIIPKPHGSDTIVNIMPLGSKQEREETLFPEWGRTVHLGPLLNLLYSSIRYAMNLLSGKGQYMSSANLKRLLKSTLEIIDGNQGSNSNADNVLAICACAELYLSSAWKEVLALIPQELQDGGDSIWGGWVFDETPEMTTDARRALAGKKVYFYCGSSIQALLGLIRYCGLNRIPWRKCSICGRLFISSTHQSKYCSDECRLKAKELNDEARIDADKILISLRNAKNYSRLASTKAGGAVKTTEQAFAFFDRLEQLHSEWKKTNRAMVRAVKADKVADEEYRKWVRTAAVLNENRDTESAKFLEFLTETQQKYKDEFGQLNIFF